MFCFANETDSSTILDVSAVKSGSLSSAFALTVTASVPQSIVQQGQSVIGEVGSVESFDLTPVLKNGFNLDSMNDALSITVNTNSKRPVLVDVWFSAFRDTTRYKGEDLEFDGVAASFVSVTWTARSTEPGYTTADQDFGNVRYAYRLNVTGNNTTLTAKNTSAVQATDAAGKTMNLVFTPVAENASIPETSAATLPGFNIDENEAPITLISRTVIYNMKMGKKFDEIPANTNYTCTVRITVKGD